MDKKVHVALITDTNYAFPTKVMLHSMKQNKQPDTVYHIHIIGVDLNQASQRLLLSQGAPDFIIDLVLAHNDYAAIGLRHTHVSKAALFKFMLPHLFPQLDRILYLDTDMIVRADLAPIYHTDLQHYWLAAIKDCGNLAHEHSKRLHTQEYFNSGFMLFNLAACRQANTSELLFEAKRKDTLQKFMDQDAFNTVFDKHVLFLPMQYNCMAYNLARYPDADLAKYYGLTKEQFLQHRTDPVILHLTNKIKPWTDALKPGAEDFWKYTEKMDVIRYMTLRMNTLLPKPLILCDMITYSFLGIPLFKKKYSRCKVRFYFLGLEIFKRKIVSAKKKKYYICGIPVWKMKKALNKTTYYLFSFIPIWSVTEL